MQKSNRFITLDSLSDLRSKILKKKKIIDNSADISGLALSLFNDHIKPIIEVYNPIISKLAPHNSNSLNRARICLDDTPYTKVSDLMNPPVPSGRAATSLDIPILYASSSDQTCLAESRVKIGNFVNTLTFDYSNIADGKFWFVGQLGEFHKSQDPSSTM